MYTVYMYEHHSSDLENDPSPEYLYSGGGSHLLHDLQSVMREREGEGHV